jgi:hypothetical protein
VCFYLNVKNVNKLLTYEENIERLPIQHLNIGDLPMIHEALVNFLHAKMVNADGAGIWKLGIIPFLQLGFWCNLSGFPVGEAGIVIHRIVIVQ